jgi:hypothetical protein
MLWGLLFLRTRSAKGRKQCGRSADSPRRAADTLPQSETNRCTTSGQRLERVATVFVYQRDTLDRGETANAPKKLKEDD